MASVRRDLSAPKGDEMPEMPSTYRGREQTWLKHRVLFEYVRAWAHKLASPERDEVHLWYVDCFAGPWRSQALDREDTSPAIGLAALNEAADTWGREGRRVRSHAIFVEKDSRSFHELAEFVAAGAGSVDARVLHGEFGGVVDAIDREIGDAPAFILIDPTGWKGVGLRFVAQLARRPRRDVLVNVMYDHVQRFKDDPRDFLRVQMAEFFGLPVGALPQGLSERELMGLYRERLRELSGLQFVADLAVPVPYKDRTYFRLVLGAGHPKAVELFRDVERRVIGQEAAPVRAKARDAIEGAKTRQGSLFGRVAPPVDPEYADQRSDDERELREKLPGLLVRRGATPFGRLWPELLCDHHLTLTDLKRLARELADAGMIEIHGMRPNERTIKDDHQLSARR